MRWYPDGRMFLTLLALLPLIWWRWSAGRRRGGVRFSSLAHLKRQGASWAVKARHVVPALRSLAIALLIVCMARPQKGDEETRIATEGIAIELVIDRSSSMLAEDFQIDGKRVDRLEAVKSVVRDFVLGSKKLDLPGRRDDLVGMMTFAGYADSMCPMTLDHAYVVDMLEDVEIADGHRYPGEDGTAIGDALALGAERLRELDKRRTAMEANRIKSRIMVLLTDGEQTAGDFAPDKGAELAKALGIRVYTIGMGSTGMAPMPYTDPFGRRGLRPVPSNLDESTLKKIAEITGGAYFRATDTDSLRDVYARIDKLERTETVEQRYLQHADLATTPVTVAGLYWPPLLCVVLGLLAIEILLANTRFRKVP